MFRWLLKCFNLIVFILLITSSITVADSNLKCKEALSSAQLITYDFYSLFERCVKSAMPNQEFLQDNLQKFVNFPAKTTVGIAPKFTNNRKFFSNMLNSAAFQQMLEDDEEELKKDLLKKLKYCDEATMDKELLKDFYDREVDQTKV